MACARCRAGSFRRRTTVSVHFVEGTNLQRGRGYSPAVISEGGRIVWLSGHVAPTDAAGRDLSADFEAQVHCIFVLLDQTLRRAGGSLANLVSMTVYVSSAADIESFLTIRTSLFEPGRYPSSALLVVQGFARPAIRVEVQGVAVIDKEGLQ